MTADSNEWEVSFPPKCTALLVGHLCQQGNESSLTASSTPTGKHSRGNSRGVDSLTSS